MTYTVNSMVLERNPISGEPWTKADLDGESYTARAMEAFKASPLANALTWLDTGAPPRAELEDAGYDGGWRPGLASRMSLYDRAGSSRYCFNALFGYALPCAEAVAAIAALSPIVEVGAGTGFWAALLAKAGADVVATDAVAPGERSYFFKVGTWHPIEHLAAEPAVLRYPDRNLFCSWPSYGEPWLAEALAHLAPGRHLALIGEPDSGCTGDDSLFTMLDDNDEADGDFQLLDVVRIPQFNGMHDRLTIYRRRSA